MAKDYIYYSPISIKEGVDIESEKLHLDIFDKDISRRWRQELALDVDKYLNYYK